MRTRVGLFDVSHMGEIEMRGPHALALVQHVTSNDAAKLSIGQAQYSGLMTPQGTFVDDLLVHKISDSHYFLCVNAGNQDRDHDTSSNTIEFGAEVENAGPRYSQLAIQGPRALELLAEINESAARADQAITGSLFGGVNGVDCLIARTGYTGEDGFEIYFAPEHSEKLWSALMNAGKPLGVMPAAWAHEIRCGSRRAWPLRARDRRDDDAAGKRISRGSAKWTKAIFWAGTHSSSKGKKESNAHSLDSKWTRV